MDDKHCRIYTISAPTQALASASTSRSDSSDPQILPLSKRGRKRIRPVRRKTKATNTLRKEEKEAILVDIEALQARIEDLQRQTKKCKGCDRIGRINEELHVSVEQRQLALIKLDAMAAESQRLQALCPTEVFIHLGADPETRQATLLRIRDSKIADAQRYLEIRCQHLDFAREFIERRQYNTPNGDICTERLSITRLPGVRSVRQVYDVMLFQMCNVEINISERLGQVTVREDDDSGHPERQQIRLVSNTPWGVSIESNSVMIAEYKKRDRRYGDGRECATYVSDFVDEDDVHPYIPLERIRRDSCGIVRLMTIRRDDNHELEVVAVHWARTRVHFPQFDLSPDSWQSVISSMELWAETIHDSVSDALMAPLGPCVEPFEHSQCHEQALG